MKKKWKVMVLILSWVVSMFGCEKNHILDGPGMVNDRPWKSFTLSRTDSYSQYNFWFTVEEREFGLWLTGECRDEEGNEYAIEEGVQLSAKDHQYLLELWLGDLRDVVPDEDDGDLFILDAPEVRLVLTWRDGTEQEKALPQDISIQMYEHFLPYFKNKT